MTTRTDRKPTRPRRAALAPMAGTRTAPRQGSRRQSWTLGIAEHDRRRTDRGNGTITSTRWNRSCNGLSRTAAEDAVAAATAVRLLRNPRAAVRTAQTQTLHWRGLGAQSGGGDIEAPPTPSLPPIADKIRAKIIRGEFIDLSTLLPGNLLHAATRKREPHDHARSSRSYKQAVEITDFTAWLEAWSSYASVVASYFPMVAPRMFQWQQFLAGKSRKFKLNAWLQNDRVSSEALPQQEPAL